MGQYRNGRLYHGIHFYEIYNECIKYEMNVYTMIWNMKAYDVTI